MFGGRSSKIWTVCLCGHKRKGLQMTPTLWAWLRGRIMDVKNDRELGGGRVQRVWKKTWRTNLLVLVWHTKRSAQKRKQLIWPAVNSASVVELTIVKVWCGHGQHLCHSTLDSGAQSVLKHGQSALESGYARLEYDSYGTEASWCNYVGYTGSLTLKIRDLCNPSFAAMSRSRVQQRLCTKEFSFGCVKFKPTAWLAWGTVRELY